MRPLWMELIFMKRYIVNDKEVEYLHIEEKPDGTIKVQYGNITKECIATVRVIPTEPETYSQWMIVAIQKSVIVFVVGLIINVLCWRKT